MGSRWNFLSELTFWVALGTIVAIGALIFAVIKEIRGRESKKMKN